MNDSNVNIGDVLLDLSTNTYSICVDNGSYVDSVASWSAMNIPIKETEYGLSIDATAKVKIGDLVITGEEFETCVRHLLKITKDANPEEFI